MLVDTIKGPIERHLLTVKDTIEEGPNYRKVSSRWYLGDELVKEDCAVSILSGLEVGAAQQNV